MELRMWMTSCPEVMGWGFWVIFWKKAMSWDLDLGEASWFLDLGESSPVGSTRCAVHGGVRWNSQLSRSCVSLSSCWKPKSQEGNKFRTWTKESRQCFGIPMHVNVLLIRIFYISISWLYYNFPCVTKQTCICLEYIMSGGLERRKRSMATLTLQFKMKCGFGWGELARVAYTNFSKWTYWPSMKTPHVREMARYFLQKANTWIGFTHDTEHRKTAGNVGRFHKSYNRFIQVFVSFLWLFSYILSIFHSVGRNCWVRWVHFWRGWDPRCWVIHNLDAKWSHDQQYSTSALPWTRRAVERPNLINRLVISSPSTNMIKSWLYSTNCWYGKHQKPFYFKVARRQWLKVNYFERKKTLTFV